MLLHVAKSKCMPSNICADIKVIPSLPSLSITFSVGKVYKPKKSEELRRKEEEEKKQNAEDIDLGEEWEEALKNATEEDLVDLAGACGGHEPSKCGVKGQLRVILGQ